MTRAFQRRPSTVPHAWSEVELTNRCGCPLGEARCMSEADGEDRLCSYCRHEHRPDEARS